MQEKCDLLGSPKTPVDIHIFKVEILNEEKVKWLASLKRGLKLNFRMNIL